MAPRRRARDKQIPRLDGHDSPYKPPCVHEWNAHAAPVSHRMAEPGRDYSLFFCSFARATATEEGDRVATVTDGRLQAFCYRRCTGSRTSGTAVSAEMAARSP